MKTITLRKIPPEIANLIRQKAEAEGLSLAKTTFKLLEEGLGIRRKKKARTTAHHDLDSLAGCWSKEEAAAFKKALRDQRQIDPEMWTK